MRDLRKRFADAWASGFLRSVVLLAGGTTVAQAIMVIALPIVTRLYTPADFGVLAVFMGLVSIIAVAACLRFDVAIPIPDNDSDAANALGLALTFAVLISSLLALCVQISPATIASWFNQPSLEAHLWLLPFGVMLSASYSALQYWFVRTKQFQSIAATRVTQSCAGAATQIGLGSVGWSPLGLILGQMLNNGAGCIGLIYRMSRTEKQKLKAVSWSRMISVYSAYDRFPKYSTFEALFNSAGMQVPIIIIAALAVGPEAGLLSLALYVIQAPMGLIGSAVSQVYLSNAPVEYRAGRLGSFTVRIFGGLVRSGIGPLIFAGIVAPDLFAVVFGSEWHRAGVLVSWMTPWFVMQFLSVPLSLGLHVARQQGVALGLQLFGLIFRVGAVYGASVATINLVSEAYALSGLVFYLFYLIVILRVVDARPEEITGAIKAGLPIIVAWSIGGCVFALVNKALLALVL